MAQGVFGENLQAAVSAMAPTTISWPYGCLNATGPLTLNSGASQNILKGYVATSPGSVVGASWIGAAPQATTGNVVVYKNNAVFFTAITGANFAASSVTATPKFATFQNGVYPYAAGDYFDVYYSGSGASLYMGVAILFNQGITSVSGVSTPITANTTASAVDNQRVWLANAATQYTLTLPSTSAVSDFYLRAVVTGGAGVTIQAPSGVTILRGSASSSAGGTLALTQAGTYAILYNPAGTNIWIVTDPAIIGTLT